MDIKQYKLKQLDLEEKAMKEFCSLENPSQKEKDIFNFKMQLYRISPYSNAWRNGMCGTLKRAIKLLERQG